jgi:hypothetical protein
MLANSIEISNLHSLRNYVQERICEQNHLEAGAFEMTERILVRGEQPCGIFFCIHGPRSVKLTAIWETEKNTILFYGSGGQRLQRTTLSVAPELAMNRLN